jgi:hypothetical protein
MFRTLAGQRSCGNQAKFMSNEVTAMSSEIRYRVVIGGMGIVFDGYSMSEAHVQFRIFVVRSKTAASRLPAGSVLLFKNHKIILEYRPPGA